MLDHSEVKLDRPSEQVQSCDDLCWDVQVICYDPKNAITTRSRNRILAFATIQRVDLNHDHSGCVVGRLVGLFTPKPDDLVAKDVFLGGLLA